MALTLSRMSFSLTSLLEQSRSGLMKDHGQQARASVNFAGPVDFETTRPDLPAQSLKNVLANLAVVFQNLQTQQNFHWPWPVGRGLS